MNVNEIVINARALSAPLTGVQRYATEIIARLDGVRLIAPPRLARGIPGHLWEQLVLPRRVGTSLLWSPANTGPISARRHVVTMHDLAPVDHPEWMSPRFVRWYRFLLPRLAERATRILTVSSFTKERIVECFGVSPDKVHVVPNGVDARFRPCSVTEVERVRKVLSLPPRRYVLSVGSLEPRKNLARLLRAWERAQTSLPDDVSLVVAGAKGGRRVFGEFSLTNLPPRVRLVGYVADDDLPALYAGADAFVYPSLYEGFGLPPLEAMATGTPVLTGNRSSIPEVVGDAGLMVDPTDVDALSGALIRLLTDDPLRARLRDVGLERVRRFTWERAADEVRRILDEASS